VLDSLKKEKKNIAVLDKNNFVWPYEVASKARARWIARDIFPVKIFFFFNY